MSHRGHSKALTGNSVIFFQFFLRGLVVPHNCQLAPGSSACRKPRLHANYPQAVDSTSWAPQGRFIMSPKSEIERLWPPKGMLSGCKPAAKTRLGAVLALDAARDFTIASAIVFNTGMGGGK